MAMTELAVGATQTSQKELIQMFIFKEHVINALLSSPIFGQYSVGPDCGANHICHGGLDNTQMLRGSQGFVRGLLTHCLPMELLGQMCGTLDMFCSPASVQMPWTSVGILP